ncbi:MAG: N-acetylmuramoyl-L-alanine amidase, partial [Sinomicrobium sp.]|nr:N-acetylmuramoyl-L-alanine amidase [Sinomicrobium sp.]
MNKRALIIPFLCVTAVILLSLKIPGAEKRKRMFTVVLDAGHGGHDPGKVAKGYKEKDVALKIALLIGRELEKTADINVVYTRKTDVFVNLFKRGEIANKADADLFISVHCNAHHTEAYGSETYVLGLHANKQNFEVAKAENEVIYLEENHEINYAGYDINAPESFIGLTIMQEEFLDQSILLAKNIQDNLSRKLNRKNRGVKQAGFIVLHQTFMPSVLVETGFITNSDERKYLLSEGGQQNIAKNIADAVFKYKKVIEENVGDDLTYETGTATSAETTVPAAFKDVVFKVQIAASSRKLETKSFNFQGLSPISMEPAGTLYKYFYGATSVYEEA